VIGKELSVDEIKFLIRKATLTANFFPVFCGTAFKNIGIKLLLDSVINYLPSPREIKPLNVFSLDNEETFRLEKGLNYPLALAFKIVIDKYNNKLTFFRVYSGKILSNSYIYNVNQQKKERISRLVRMNADKKEEIKEVGVGDIAAAIGLESTVTGDTLGSEENNFLLENIKFNDPVISLAIEAQSNKDKDKLREALEKLKVQDPSFKYYTDKRTNQMLISGMGELHLEVTVERLRREHEVQVATGKPRVAYQETIKNKVDSEGVYKHQSGGHGQFGVVNIKFEPNPGKGFEFINAIREGAIPKEYIPSVKDGLMEIFVSGPLLGYPVVDVKATLYDGKFHDVDSSNLAFKNAAILSFKNSCDKMGIELLEPIMKLEVTIPEDYYGVTLASLTSQRGLINEVEKQENDYVIHGQVPLSNILGYTTVLRSLTGGKGVFNMELSHYQKVPNEVLKEITKREKLS
jgi:elongation factor G